MSASFPGRSRRDSLDPSSRPSSPSAQRRIQRSVRVTVSTGLLALAAMAVAVAVVTDTWVNVAAVFSVLAGAAAARILCTEVTQTRHEAAIARAEMARDFGQAMTKNHEEHVAFTESMSTQIAQRDKALAARDRTIVELNGTIRLAEKRADVAEDRVRRESKRANDAQERLAVLLDEVLMAQSEALSGVGIPEAADLPTIVDLLAWEDRTSEAMLQELRHQA